MTNDERKRIERLRKNGNSFSRIAEITELSRDSVRIYCSRNNIVPGKSGDSCCQQCGKELAANTGKGSKALFCSSRCRIIHWQKMKEKDRNYTKVWEFRNNNQIVSSCILTIPNIYFITIT